jgi:homoprotocatechuate degradation regulator HpaR
LRWRSSSVNHRRGFRGFPLGLVVCRIRLSDFSTFRYRAFNEATMSDSSRTSTRVAHRNLPMLLLRAREKMMERFRPLITAHGLTEQQWRVIRALNESGPLEPRQISDICTISSPSMAGVLARMEALGLVTKERFADDQRRVLVTLTKKSHQLVKAISKELEARYAALEAEVGPEVVERVYRAIDDLLAGLE